MDYDQIPMTPCPQCGGWRFATDPRNVGMSDLSQSYAVCCSQCGYLAFYATPQNLQLLLQIHEEKTERAAKQRETDLRQDRF
jgi:hypothetical protein